MRCPVCQARFRGTARCSRCGAGLEPLMRLAIHAWQKREAARKAIGEGDWQQARRYAGEAQESCRTETGRSLRILAEWLASA